MDWDSAIQLPIPGCDSKTWAIGTWIAMWCLLLDVLHQKFYWAWLLPYVLCPMLNHVFNESDKPGLSVKVPLHVTRLPRKIQEQPSLQLDQPAYQTQTDAIQQFISDWVRSKCQVVPDTWLWDGSSSLGADLDECDLYLWTDCLSDVRQLVP